ncbi:MAG: Uma2 family endonuclease [Planctomycetes bacterium]|nr:Uma2 family endonuclease [Planctomycetota bacterium]
MSPTVELLLELLLPSPCLPEIAETLQARLRDEACRRDRFYKEMTDAEKVEFIEGKVVVHSPARNSHLIVQQLIARVLSSYVDLHKIGEVRSEKCLCVFPRNDYEPDVVFFGRSKAANFAAGTMKFPVPDLVVEVLSDSTADRDRGVKFDDYQAHGVLEYWIVDPDSEVVEQYLIRDGRFELTLKSNSGELACPTLNGATFPIKSFFDAAQNLLALQAILRTYPNSES